MPSSCGKNTVAEDPPSGTTAGELASDLAEPSLRREVVLRMDVLLRRESCLMLADDLARPRLARASLLAGSSTSDSAACRRCCSDLRPWQRTERLPGCHCGDERSPCRW